MTRLLSEQLENSMEALNKVSEHYLKAETRTALQNIITELQDIYNELSYLELNKERTKEHPLTRKQFESDLWEQVSEHLKTEDDQLRFYYMEDPKNWSEYKPCLQGFDSLLDYLASITRGNGTKMIGSKGGRYLSNLIEDDITRKKRGLPNMLDIVTSPYPRNHEIMEAYYRNLHQEKELKQ